ncbi:hypothetical protein [Treponema sp. J25]|uniref:hypothetical protein n=1 Tax=Treponema sp. J25 TaxID=2094121 RepID=UPI00104A7DDE|nr:hypothetical protein [Treponema sp. J25]TCW61479.1 hypothetical protein C5O22_06055 [Treponema sp. J25]
MKRKILLFTLVICTFLLFTQCDIFFYAPKLEYVITGSNISANIEYNDYKAGKIVRVYNISGQYWSSGVQTIRDDDCPFLAYIKVTNTSSEQNNSIRVSIKVDGDEVKYANVSTNTSTELTYIVE